jgi:hypothetical protein
MGQQQTAATRLSVWRSENVKHAARRLPEEAGCGIKTMPDKLNMCSPNEERFRFGVLMLIRWPRENPLTVAFHLQFADISHHYMNNWHAGNIVPADQRPQPQPIVFHIVPPDQVESAMLAFGLKGQLFCTCARDHQSHSRAFGCIARS